MKARITEDKVADKGIEYPYLMKGKFTGKILLITALDGVVVIDIGTDTSVRVGERISNLIDNSYAIFKGTIELSND